MAKFKLNPQSGTIEDSKNVRFELTDLQSKKVRFSIDNTTNLVKSHVKEIKQENNSLSGVVDLNISETTSQSTISIFAILEEEVKDGVFKLSQVFPAVYYIRQKNAQFKNKVSITNPLINIDEITGLHVSSNPNEKLIFSINDKRIPVILNKEGNGSVHFRGKDVYAESDIKSAQKFPIYVYSIETNYNTKKSTGLNLTILPSDIKSQATIEEIDPRCLLNETWVLPEDCKKHPPQELNPDIIPQIPDSALDTKVCDFESCLPCTCENHSVTLDTSKICRISDSSCTLTNNGMVLYSYISVDKTKTDGQIGYNVSRVFITKDESSLNKPVIAVQKATISPHLLPGDAFGIYVDEPYGIQLKELVETPGKSIYAVIFDSRTVSFGLKVLSVEEDVYSTSYILTTETNEIPDVFSEPVYCQYVVFYDGSVSAPSINLGTTSPLPYITDNDGTAISAIRSTIVCNPNFIQNITTDPYLSGRQWTPVYIIAEAMVDNKIQLFLYALAIEPNSNSDLSYGWKKLTSDGENKNAKSVIDKYNNIHIVWESNRAGGSDYQLYYGVIGPSSISLCNMALSSIIDKQAELNANDDKPDYYLEHDILIPAEEDYCPRVDISKNWETYSSGDATVTASGDNVEISTNPTNNMSMAMSSINSEMDISDGLYEQLNFQISFNITPSLTQPTIPEDENQLYFTFGSLLEGDFGLAYYYRQAILEGDFPLSTNSYQVPGTYWASLMDGDFGVGFYYQMTLLDGDFIGISGTLPNDYTVYDEVLNQSVKNTIYEEWKSKYVLNTEKSSYNFPIYTYDNNDFILGRDNSIYDRFVPMVGSYKMETDPYIMDNFQVIASGETTLRPFMIGFIPEKMRLKATNTMDKESYDALYGLDEYNGSNYIAKDEREIYTGNSKLVFVYSSYDNEDENSSVIVRNISDNFPMWAETKLDIIVHYSKMFKEDIASYFNLKDANNVSSKFICTVTVLKNSSIDNYSPIFSESFLTNLGDSFRAFDIGFGVPSGGQYISNEYVPYNSSIFENNNVNLKFSNINITSSLFSYNTTICSFPNYILYPYTLSVEETNMTGAEDVSTSFYDSSFALTPESLSMGLDENIFPQIPITLAGNNKSANMCLGIGNDVHIAWQSNRDRHWNIYTSNSYERNFPFRKETQITNTEKNCLCPSISVNETGKRMIVWHDDRNNKYEIFAARAFDGYISKANECILLDENTNPVVCTIDMDFISAIDGISTFVMEFYSDNSTMNLYKSISTKNGLTGWKIDGNNMSGSYQYINDETEGVDIIANTTYNISYEPNESDGVFDRVLYCKLVSNVLIE